VRTALVDTVSLVTAIGCAYLSDRIVARKGVRHCGFGPVGVLAAIWRSPRGLGHPAGR
jgi:hypothetical protein